ncbi:M1 family aminopeptidase [Vairimorpha necatrix]|uniref:Aminopeptidase n=1 Tax=Vairimorpha necatrix TaxID=6039 RepID=A0AAX4JF40_9MICR
MKEVLDYNVAPEHYNLKIEIENDHFTGEEEVNLKVLRKTNKFNFNEDSLELKEVKLFVNDEEKQISFVSENTFVNLEIQDGEICCEDKVILFIKFKGYYSEDMWGFYKSKYNEDDLFSTDFEPTNARRAFPSWDQPDMKAAFTISIKPLEGFGALSNSSLKEIKDGYYCFNTTPKMSTYIVAYISGKLEAFEWQTKRGVPIKVYSHKDEKDWGEYPAKVAAECLDFFEEYFNIEYPLPKLDLVTIPTFVSGAMENWGLVTFRKTSLLFDKETSSLRSKKNIALTVCHELAHMWFGNLVTMSWWNDLWLNEGFATWASYLAMNNLSKDLIDWDVWTEFINDDIESGMKHDCLKSSHPIAVTVNKPSDINQIFDTISYSKGASMIRMLEGYIGEEAFKEGIRNYLNKFKYSNASTDDLWMSFREELNVQVIMNDWITRQGFPILNIKDTSENSNNSASSETEDDHTNFNLNIEQQRFLLSGTNNRDLWKIPLKIRWFGEQENTETILMIDKNLTLQKKSKIYKFNDEASSFYRVRYPLQNLAELLKLDISTSNKLNLINDIFALIFSNRMLAIDGIVLSELFIRESNPEILSSILTNLSKIRSIFSDETRVVNHINEVIWDITGERAKNIDFLNKNLKTDESVSNSLLLWYAFSTNNKDLNQKLNEGFDFYKQGKSLNPEYIRSIFSSVADAKFDDLWKLAKESKLPDEKTMALSSLAHMKKENMLKKMLSLYTEIEPHNSIYFFLYLSGNLVHRSLIINYILDNFDNIRSFMKNDRLFQYVIENVLGIVSCHKLGDKVIEILTNKKNGDIVMAINKTIEKIKHNQEFREYNSDLVTEKD